MTQSQLQLGKNKVTEKFLETLKSHFKNHENVKVSVLKGATRNKDEIRKISSEILSHLGRNYTSRMVGFTIFLKKWKRDMR